MTSERMIMVPDWLVEEAASLIEQAGMSGTGVSLTAPRLRAALAQPAAGEPEQQTAINADDLPTKKYPLADLDFDVPVAAGDAIQVEAVAVTREGNDGLYLDWVLEGGISALEAPGVVLLVAHGKVTDDQGSGEVYLAPPAAAAVAAGEPVAFSTEHGALFWHGSPQDWKGKPVQLYLAPPAAAHGDEAVQIKLTDLIRCSDEMHERGEKAVERAIKDQCFDRRTQFKVYFEAAIGEWFSQQKAEAQRAQAGEGGEV